MRTATAILFVLCLAAAAGAAEIRVVSEDLDVRFDPGAHRIDGVAELSLAPAAGAGELAFSLGGGVTPASIAVDGAAIPVPAPSGEGWLREYRIAIPAGAQVVRIVYGGEIHDAVKKAADLAFVIGDKTRGVISEEGIFLTAGSGWYPLTDGLTAFPSIRVTVPSPLVAVTQGEKLSREVAEGREVTRWGSAVPVDGLALQAGKYEIATRKVGDVAVSTYLFAEDAGFSEFILDEVEGYLAFYRPYLGEYPWPKFDIVENFFATGYGMPTYTLLGNTVVQQMMRMAPRYGNHLPPGFVDHELVHCWWGNYVYPDYATGNWCEGLTTYCSNYLRKEVESEAEATAHRKKICTTFSIQVHADNDYPVRRFTGKTEDFENDIGYGKAAMIFHMARRRMGSDTFFAALRTVIREYGGKHASWDDFARVFSDAAGEDLSGFFDQWLDRTGGPVLEAGPWSVKLRADGLYEVTGEIRQVGEPWRLDVPVTAEHPGGVSYRSVPMDGPTATYTLVSPRPPLTVSVDADFNLFRVLPLDQIRPGLNLTLSRPGHVYVVPEGRDDYRGLAEAAKERKGGEIVAPGPGLPDGSAVLYGRPEENPSVAPALAAAGVTVEGAKVTIDGKSYEGDDLWVLFTIPHPEADGEFLTVFFGTTPAALARAFIVFYYGWDGYIVYRGRAPIARGDLTEIEPRTVRALPLSSDAAETEAIVRALAGAGGRGAGTESGKQARATLLAALERAGVESPSEEPFAFRVRDFDDPDAWTTAQGTLENGETKWVTAYPGAVVPALFSAEAPEGVHIGNIVNRSSLVDGESLLMLPKPESADALAVLLAAAGDTKAAAIGIPMSVLESKDPALAGLAAYPSRLEVPKGEDPWFFASGRQARAVEPPIRMPCPVVFVDDRLLPPGGTGDADATLRVRFSEKVVESANLVAGIPAPNGAADAAPVLLTAHYDAVGEGYEGADDNASGVAAVLGAARALAERKDLLRRPVRVVLFGAEEWGLRGSTAYARRHRARMPVVNLDTVGAADQAEVYVIGRSLFPELAARAAECLRTEGFPVGKDIDRFALANGSDHWPFAARGTPAIDLYSGQYRRMNSPDDVIGLVSFPKIARIGRAAARLVLDLAAEDLK